MAEAENDRRDAVLHEVALRSRRRKSGRAARRAAALRAVNALRAAASAPSRDFRSS